MVGYRLQCREPSEAGALRLTTYPSAAPCRAGSVPLRSLHVARVAEQGEQGKAHIKAKLSRERPQSPESTRTRAILM